MNLRVKIRKHSFKLINECPNLRTKIWKNSKVKVFQVFLNLRVKNGHKIKIVVIRRLDLRLKPRKISTFKLVSEFPRLRTKILKKSKKVKLNGFLNLRTKS